MVTLKDKIKVFEGETPFYSSEDVKQSALKFHKEIEKRNLHASYDNNSVEVEELFIEIFGDFEE